MSETANKVKFGLKKLFYAILTKADDGTISYATPVVIPGAVSLSMDPEGENENFYADDSVYYVIANNSGYSGDLEVALFPESFRKDVLGEKLDANGLLVENAEVEPVPFALLFEFTGDKKKIRHVFYNCTISRPGVEGKTTEDSKKVTTETATVTAVPLADGYVKAKTGTGTTADVYDKWYDSVHQYTAPTNG